jgi:hypothetical protein
LCHQANDYSLKGFARKVPGGKDSSRKGAKRRRVSLRLCGFAPLREKQFLSSKALERI